MSQSLVCLVRANYISPQVHIQCAHAGSLTLTMAGVFTPREEATPQRTAISPEKAIVEWGSLTSGSLGAIYYRSTYIPLFREAMGKGSIGVAKL